MNATLLQPMKFAALLAVVVFSVQPVQRSTCRCQDCPQLASVTVECDDQSCYRKMTFSCEMGSHGCCFDDGPVAPGKRCPCGCQQASADQGIEPQSELPQVETVAGDTTTWFLSSVTNPRSATAQRDRSTPGVSLCIALCRFRL